MLTRRLCGFCCALILCQVSVFAASLDEKRIEFSVPAAPWTLILPAEDFVVEQQQIKPDGRAGYFLMNDRKRMMTVSFFIEPVKNCKDSKELPRYGLEDGQSLLGEYQESALS